MNKNVKKFTTNTGTGMNSREKDIEIINNAVAIIKKDEFVAAEFKNVISEMVTIDRKDLYGDTLLHHTIKNHNLAAFQIVLLAKSDINLKNEHGWDAFSLAFENHQHEMIDAIRMVTDNKIDMKKISKADEYQEMFRNALMERKVEFVKYMIEHEFEINVYSGEQGNNYLMEYLQKSKDDANPDVDKEIVKVLKNNEGQIYNVNKNGQTAMYFVPGGNESLIDLSFLTDYDCTKCSGNEMAAVLNSIEKPFDGLSNKRASIAVSLNHMSNVKEPNKQGLTLLMQAVNLESEMIVEVLLSTNKCDINKKNNDGKTAEEMAEELFLYDIFKLLKDYRTRPGYEVVKIKTSDD